MPSRFVLQPNGKLARFSTVVDHFTHYDMTREEAYDVACDDMGRRDAEAKVERGLRDELENGQPGDGLSRFREALEDIERVHGKAEREKYEELLKVPSP